MCLICGHVGCGRYSGEHAHVHYEVSKHTYSMELDSQRVWDYAGDGYVHRLIQNKNDGKIVEFPHPHGITEEDDSRIHTASSSSAASKGYSDNISKDKLDEAALEYEYLLTSQLESQRDYYVDKMYEQDIQTHEQVSLVEAKLRESEHHAMTLEKHIIVRNVSLFCLLCH